MSLMAYLWIIWKWVYKRFVGTSSYTTIKYKFSNSLVILPNILVYSNQWKLLNFANLHESQNMDEFEKQFKFKHWNCSNTAPRIFKLHACLSLQIKAYIFVLKRLKKYMQLICMCYPHSQWFSREAKVCLEKI